MLKKTISKIMAVTMLVSSIGQISLLNTVSAAEQASTKDVWIDFENYNSVADVPTDSSGDFYLQTTGTAAAEVATIDNNKSLKLVNVDSKNYNYFQVKFDQEATKTQKVIIEYDMMTFNEPTTDPKGQLKTEIHYNASSLKTAAMIQSSWKNSQFTEGGVAGSTSVPKAGTWYHVKHELDCANDTAYTIFTDREAGTKLYEKSVTNFTEYEYLRALGFHSTSSTGRTSYFDNIKIDYVYDVPNPEISIYAGDALQSDLTAVSADTDTLKVNFNADMDESTVTNENIYVVNTLTNEAVGTDVSYADGVATVVLTNGVQKGATYKVVVKENVVNPEGIGAGDETALEFTVANDVAEDTLAQGMEIDFEDLSIADIPSKTGAGVAYYLDTIYTDETQTQAVAEIVELDGNNVIKLESQGSKNYRQFRINFDEEASKKAKITVEYDMMSQHDPAGTPAAQLRTEVFYTKGTTNGFKVAAMVQKAWKNSEFTGNGLAGSASVPVAGNWYHVKHEMDIANSTAYTVFTDKATGAAIYGPKTVTSFTWADYLRGMGFQCSSSSGRTMFFDNITVSYTYDEPKVTADSVKLYANGAFQSDKTQVSQLTNSLTVDFGTAMDVDTLTYNNFYVSNKATGAKVASTLAGCTNGVAELEFTETLAKNTTYVLNISDSVLSATGVAIADYTPVEFTVAGAAETLPTEKVGEDLVIDFEKYDSISGIPTDSTQAFYLNTTGTAAAEIETIDDNKVIKLEAVDGKNYQQFRVNIDKEASKEAKVVVEYDMMTNDEDTKKLRTELYYTGGAGWSVLSYLAPAWTSLNNGAGTSSSFANDPEAGVWYHVKHEFDIKNGKNTASLTKADNTPIVSANSYKDTITDIWSVGFHCSSVSGSTAYYDNIKVSYVYDAPVVTKDSISLVNTEGAVQSNWNNVSLLTKAVKIDFGTVMDTSTLTADNVYLANKATGEKVDAVLTYADGVLALNLAQKLASEAVYKIVVTEDVTNAKGIAVSDYTPLEFTTGKSTRTAVLTGAYVGSSKVTELSDIKAGDKLTINVSYANSTSEDQTVNVLIAYYAGNALDHVELVKTENISASVATMNYSYDHTVSDLTDITKVKVFSWDDFSNMVPLSGSIVLD